MIHTVARPSPTPRTGQSDTDLRALACVIVTYQPDFEVLARELQALPDDAAVAIVDNASGPGTTAALHELLAARYRATLYALVTSTPSAITPLKP